MTRGNRPSKVPARPFTRYNEADIDRINSGMSNLQAPTLNGGHTPPMSWAQQARMPTLSGSRGPPNANAISSSQIPTARDVLLKYNEMTQDQQTWLTKQGILEREGFEVGMIVRALLHEGDYAGGKNSDLHDIMPGSEGTGTSSISGKDSNLSLFNYEYIYTKLRYLIVIATTHNNKGVSAKPEVFKKEFVSVRDSRTRKENFKELTGFEHITSKNRGDRNFMIKPTSTAHFTDLVTRSYQLPVIPTGHVLFKESRLQLARLYSNALVERSEKA
ncbi:hypothetical protein OEA41_001909 [Lepraria neglecta]|uniref:Uncharacterized protein n=1 Tax=Lepraria neglecta TaxID=209136 RepID=A0AAE0DPF8_9LECA|nr:hypothetical protein OEA41_001909 [Lepraria neglecta]